MTAQPDLNPVEKWIAEHAIRIFLAIAVLMIVGAYFLTTTIVNQSNTQEDVNVLQPRVTRIVRTVCGPRAFDDPVQARHCAGRLRAALLNCRQYTFCRTALVLAQVPPPRKAEPEKAESQPQHSAGGGGGDAQTPSHQGQQHGGGGPHKKPPAPNPSPIPVTPAPIAPAPVPEPAPGNSGEHSQGNGPATEPPGQAKKGVDVEACALATCVHVGLGE